MLLGKRKVWRENYIFLLFFIIVIIVGTNLINYELNELSKIFVSRNLFLKSSMNQKFASSYRAYQKLEKQVQVKKYIYI